MVVQLLDGRYVDEDRDKQSPVPELAASGREPAHVNRWLVVALVVAAAVAATLGGLWYLDHRQTPDERAVAELVATYDRAWAAGDAAAVLDTMTFAGTFAVVPTLGASPYAGPYSGVQLADFVQQMNGMGFTLAATGRLVVESGSGGWTAAQPVRIGYRMELPDEGDQLVVQEGWELFTVVDDHGTKLISQAVWWPTG